MLRLNYKHYQYHNITCSPIGNNENAETHPDMNIDVATYDMTCFYNYMELVIIFFFLCVKLRFLW